MGILNFLRNFSADERGNSLSNLIWLWLILGLCGISIDTSNAFRMKTMMQAVADAGALGGVLELVDHDGNAPAMAKALVELNMPPEIYGEMTSEAEVLTGRWDPHSKQLLVGEKTENAVWVTLHRNDARANSLAATLLTLVGFDAWQLSVSSIALIQWKECWQAEGMIANGQVSFESESRFGDNFCVYGRRGINVNNGNDFTGLPLGGDGTGALIGTGREAYANYGCEGINHIGGGNDPCDFDVNNPGMREALFHTDRLEPRRLNDFDQAAIDTYRQIFASGGVGVSSDDYYSQEEWHDNGQQKMNPELFNTMTDPNDDHREFYLECKRDNITLKINNGNYNNILIVTNCPVKIVGSTSNDPTDHGIWENVTIITVSESNEPGTVVDTSPQKGVNFAISGGNQFGTSCGKESSVSFFSSKSVKFAGNSRYRGVELTAHGDLIMAGNQISYDGDMGSFSAHIGDDVHFTSTSDFVPCPAGRDPVVVRVRTTLVH